MLQPYKPTKLPKLRAYLYLRCKLTGIPMMNLKQIIEEAWEDHSKLSGKPVQEAIFYVMELLDQGRLRVAEPVEGGEWKVNEWVKKAVVLYFPLQQMETIEVGPFEFHDKIPLKRNYASLGVRVVPHAIARFGK